MDCRPPAPDIVRRSHCQSNPPQTPLPGHPSWASRAPALGAPSSTRYEVQYCTSAEYMAAVSGPRPTTHIGARRRHAPCLLPTAQVHGQYRRSQGHTLCTYSTVQYSTALDHHTSLTDSSQHQQPPGIQDRAPMARRFSSRRANSGDSGCRTRPDSTFPSCCLESTRPRCARDATQPP